MEEWGFNEAVDLWVDFGAIRSVYFAVSVKKDYPPGSHKTPEKTTVKTTPITAKNRHFSPFSSMVL
jgi:hypothetical protein